jgi:carbon-monoxide dehydrogenase medium subunit
MPALNLRLLAPELLVDIGGLGELRGVAVAGDTLRIGALTRHAEIANSAEIAAHAPLLVEAIAHVAHPAIRNRGTLGGSLAHADPASELPACMLALDATIVIQGQSGERRVRATDFFTGIYETALSPEDLLIAVELPVVRKDAAHNFQEFARRHGDYAIVGLAVQAVVTRDIFGDLRLAYFGVGDRPHLAQAAGKLIGKTFAPAMLADACAALDAELDPQQDHQASVPMRRHLAKVLLRRCVGALLKRPELATGASV